MAATQMSARSLNDPASLPHRREGQGADGFPGAENMCTGAGYKVTTMVSKRLSSPDYNAELVNANTSTFLANNKDRK